MTEEERTEIERDITARLQSSSNMLRTTIAIAAELLVEKFGDNDTVVALDVARRIFDDYLSRALRGDRGLQ